MISAIKDLFDLVSDFFTSIGTLLVFLWDMITQIDDMILMVTQSAANLPFIFTFIPPQIIVFASSVILISVLYLILGRNR